MSQNNCHIAAVPFANKLMAFFLILALICNSLPNCQTAIFSMADLQQQDSLFSPSHNNPKMLIGWEEFLKQRPMYGQELVLVDKIVPNQIPTKFSPSKGPAKRGDEKRRDFEHGWEQCEFSPISCMLKRRRR